MYDYFHPQMDGDALHAISSIGLAHLGDSVYEILVRTYLCVHGKATGKDLHRACIALVCAQEQARRGKRILPLLSETEHAVYRRGRNANLHAVARSASLAQYRDATALEALFGFLYLRGEQERINELFRILMDDDGAQT